VCQVLCHLRHVSRAEQLHVYGRGVKIDGRRIMHLTKTTHHVRVPVFACHFDRHQAVLSPYAGMSSRFLLDRLSAEELPRCNNRLLSVVPLLASNTFGGRYIDNSSMAIVEEESTFADAERCHVGSDFCLDSCSITLRCPRGRRAVNIWLCPPSRSCSCKPAIRSNAAWREWTLLKLEPIKNVGGTIKSRHSLYQLGFNVVVFRVTMHIFESRHAEDSQK